MGGMNCIYDWYYRGDTAKTFNLVLDWFERHPERGPGELMYVLIKSECGE